MLLLAGKTETPVKGMHRCLMRSRRTSCLVFVSPSVRANREATWLPCDSIQPDKKPPREALYVSSVGWEPLLYALIVLVPECLSLKEETPCAVLQDVKCML